MHNRIKKKRLLIFGSGFIARHIVEYAKSSDEFEIKALYNEHKIPNLNYKDQINCNSPSLIGFIDDYRPEYLILLQGQSFVPNNINMKDSVESNLMKNLMLLEILNSHNGIKKQIKKMLVVGSAAEYGKFYQDQITENFPLHPTSVYGLTKIFLFNTSMFYYERGLPIIYIRQFNIIGPYQRDCFVLPSICKQVALIEKKMKEPIINVGDLSQERDFIDVRDAVLAYFSLFRNGELGEVYNVASGKCVSINKILNLVLQSSLLEKNKITILSDKKLFSKEHSLCNRLWADVSKLKQIEFKWHYSLKETVRDTLEYWRRNV